MPKFKKPCVWNDTHYDSIKEAAQDIDVPYVTLYLWLSKGYACDEDVTHKKVPCTWNGVDYESLLSASRATGHHHKRLKAWLDKGYACDADVPSLQTYTWNGVEYPTYEAIAEATGISRQLVYHYIQKGYTCDEDIDPRNKPFMGYESLAAYGRAHGKTREWARLQRLKMTEQKENKK